MFRDMRRKKQALSEDRCSEVLYRGSCGVLALSGDDGYPYAVPLSYMYDGESIYFHSAKEGHKIDAVLKDSKASFCVIDKDEVVPKEYTTYFRSVIVFGNISIIKDEKEMRAAIEKLSKKYAPSDTPENLKKTIDGAWERLCMLKLTPEYISGKEAIELLKK